LRPNGAIERSATRKSFRAANVDVLADVGVAVSVMGKASVVRGEPGRGLQAPIESARRFGDGECIDESEDPQGYFKTMAYTSSR
jgi:hypothetical protein